MKHSCSEAAAPLSRRVVSDLKQALREEHENGRWSVFCNKVCVDRRSDLAEAKQLCRQYEGSRIFETVGRHTFLRYYEKRGRVLAA